MSESCPLVSVVINNFNYGRFLGEAINSVLAQTYQRLEVIVVDDGSTDNSREVIRGYGERIKPILQTNGGQASAINAGVGASNGDIVCFLDSDDYWLPEKVEEVVRAAQRDPKAGLIYHRVLQFSTDKTRVVTAIPASLLSGSVSRKVARCGGWWPAAPTSGISMTRALLQQMGPIPEDYRICADGFLLSVAAILAPVLGLSQVLGMYRLHGDNQWNNTRNFAPDEQRLRFQVGHFERTVSGVNDRLKELGSEYTLSIQDHWPCQRIKFDLGDADTVSLGYMVIKGLGFTAEPSLVRRLRLVANLIKTAAFNPARKRDVRTQ